MGVSELFKHDLSIICTKISKYVQIPSPLVSNIPLFFPISVGNLEFFVTIACLRRVWAKKKYNIVSAYGLSQNSVAF